MLPTPQEDEETLGSRSLSIDADPAVGLQKHVQAAVGNFAPIAAEPRGGGGQQMAAFGSLSSSSSSRGEAAGAAAVGPSSDLERLSAQGQHQDAAVLGSGVPPSWGNLSDIDLFVHFDPGFDLSAVDTALEANLDMGYPQTWTMQWPE